MKLNLAVTAVAVRNPVGCTALTLLHSVRSSISRLVVQPYPDSVKEWIVGGAVPLWVPLIRDRRLRFLAATALKEAWQQACGPDDPSPLTPTALLLGAPEPIRSGYRFPPQGFNVPWWANHLGLPTVAAAQVIDSGSCSGQLALAQAAKLLDSGEARSCLIGVADTQLQLKVIRWLEEHYRLKCSYFTDGLMPGEASCFLVVEKEQAALKRGATILARVLSTASATEKATLLSDRPNTAGGLTEAVRAALKDAAVNSTDVGTVWSDLNGESYRAREWAFAEVRLKFQTHTQLIHPADCHGDLGAATDTNLLALAAMAQATGWANGKPQLVFSGSEGGIRAATVIGPPPTEPPVVQVTRELPRVLPVEVEVPPLGPDEANYLEAENPPRAYFEWQLRQEHLEDLASLFYQRRALLRAGEVPWFRAREPEQRILNHLDAAVAGGPTSVWGVASGLTGDEEGLCFAGALLLGVLPSLYNLGLIDDVLKDPAATNLAGIEAGLRHAPSHPALRARIDAWLEHDAAAVRAMAVSLAGYRREGDARKVAALLGEAEPAVLRAAADALRRLRYVQAIPALERLLTHADPAVQRAVVLALLCLGSKRALEHCRKLCQSGAAPGVGAPFLLALYGDPTDLFVLLHAAGKAPADPDTLEALGVLGCVQAVPTLLRALGAEDEAARVAAGEALQLITGAGLRENAVVIEVTDFGDGPEEEKTEVERVSTSAEAWSQWWEQNRSRFDPHSCWRLGRELNAGRFIEELADGGSRFHDRQRAGWELAILAQQAIPFEPDWFIPRQQQGIEQWQAWWQANPPR